MGGSRERWSVSPLGLLPKRRGGAEYGEAGDERVGALQHRLMNEVAGLAAHNDKQLHTMARGERQRGAGLGAIRAQTTHLLIGVLMASSHLEPVVSSRTNMRTPMHNVLASHCQTHEESLVCRANKWA